jgi:hypothetical protein
MLHVECNRSVESENCGLYIYIYIYIYQYYTLKKLLVTSINKLETFEGLYSITHIVFHLV